MKYRLESKFLNFHISIVPLLHCGDTDLFLNTSFKERSNMAPGKARRVAISFYKKHCLPVVT